MTIHYDRGFLLLQSLTGWVLLITSVAGWLWLRQLNKIKRLPTPSLGIDDKEDNL